MSALNSKHRRGASRLSAGLSAVASSIDGFVLPRWLRRPVRTFSRLGSGDFTPPRYSMALLNVAFLASVGAYGAYVGGHMPTVVQAVTARTGFAVDQIKVVGNRQTSEIDVLERLELDGWTSLIGMNADQARDRIAALPWVEQVSVRKTYPNALEVKLSERQPFAIWQQNNELTVIEASGRVIAPYGNRRLGRLPMVMGQGAELAAADFVKKVEAYPAVASRAKAYIRVAERRWDIRFDNGVVAKLPEFGDEQALADFDRMNRESRILDKNISVVDMRVSDRVTVRLKPDAVEQRETDLKAKPKKSATSKKPAKTVAKAKTEKRV